MLTKLGGRPWIVKLGLKNSILFGSDVYHSRLQNSVGSLVSMFGDNYTETYSTSKMHTKGTELFSNLEVTVMEHIKQYEKKIGKIPNRVIFYRDGVGEDFINRLREHEIVPIQKALKQ